jgi:hypothetical protein
LYFAQTPCGERKSGIPLSVLMPAPVKATMFEALASQLAVDSISSTDVMDFVLFWI